MTILKWIIVTIVTLYILDKICLWLEDHGWLYYRRTKAESGILSSILLELNTLINPSTRHVIEVKQQKEAKKQSNAGTSDDDA